MRSQTAKSYSKMTMVFTVLLFLGSGVSVAGSDKSNSGSNHANYLPPGKLRTALADSYDVYDASGRLIGTTTDGLFVLAAFPGHEGSKFKLYVGNGETPPAVGTFNPTLFFAASDCIDGPYVQVLDYTSNHLAGVTQLRQLAVLSDG